MRLEFVSEHKSITGPVSDEDFPDFLVISGLNGSGKTHLLEALAGGNLIVQGLATARPQASRIVYPPMLRRGRTYVPFAPPLVKLFRAGELVAPADSGTSAASLRDTWAYLGDFIADYQATKPASESTTDEAETELIRELQEQGYTTAAQIAHLKRLSGKRLTELTKRDLEFYTHPVAGLRDPFTLSATQIFLSYHERRNRQDFHQWRYEKHGRSGERPLSDEEFTALFGPPPWEPLNTALRTIDLPYRFATPEGDDEDYTFEATLTDVDTGVVVKSEDLSSGERTLLAIALSLFGASDLPEAVGMPRLLLLDEPDSTLHPSMIKRLLELTNDVLVQSFGVKVVIASHSATTVALAPEPSLLIMRRDQQPRLIRSPNRDTALRSLTVGIPTLSVKLQNRRQVFVESQVDADFYEKVYGYLREQVSKDVSLEFIAAGKQEKGGGDAAVMRLVSLLRRADVTTVFGIIDRDDRQSAPDGVYYSKERRTLENFVFDPLIIGYYLLRQRLTKPSAVGLDEAVTYSDLDAPLAAQLVKGVITSLRYRGPASEFVECRYVEGFSLQVPEWYLSMPKDQLLSMLVSSFPRLQREKDLRSQVVTLGYYFRPGFVPLELRNLFTDIAAAPAT